MAVLLFLTFAAWSMGSAVGSTPDEGYVLTSIWCGETGATPDCRKDPDRYWAHDFANHGHRTTALLRATWAGRQRSLPRGNLQPRNLD